MVHNTLIIALDLGTSATTANHVRVRDSFNNRGELCRDKLGSVSDVRDWPGCIAGATGNNCVPTDLVYRKDTRELLCWGFEAQDYLDDTFHHISHNDVLVVETIKLLLPDPDEAKTPSPATERYRAMRKNLTATLAKDPFEVFEDLLNKVIAHVLENAKGKYSISLHNHQVELVLAFPAGWNERIHSTVARIGARALQQAIAAHSLKNMTFGIENVHTVSETLCGVKEWLRETMAEASSIDLETQAMNLEELNEGDCFLAIDIGGGTGCLTPLKLVSKNPLAVEQLDRTQSLEVSGEAVQAEFERMLRSRITQQDYPDDVERAIFQICRRFKEEKKKCGASSGSSSKIWNCPTIGLKANPRKMFEKDCMKFNRKHLEECFDPVIHVLDQAIEKTMRKLPLVKAIIFLGQFGGNSAYLQRKMMSNPLSAKVKIRHSQSGKLDVVKGAISERLVLEETFVREFKTLKSYGTLVTLVYDEKVARIFPDPQSHGALPFEKAHDGFRLKVVEWALPKGTIIRDGRARDIGRDGRRHHTWKFSEDELGFEDIIVISDEDIPLPQLEGMSYTLWTESHQKNQLYIAGQRVQVQQISFGWDLVMSQKLDAQGNIVGPYDRDDLRTFFFPEKRSKLVRRRHKLRVLHYDLIWEITEMQVKLYVQALFPNQIGPPLSQLGKEQALGPDEKSGPGESRSKALERDIEITRARDGQSNGSGGEDAPEDERRNIPRRISPLIGSQQLIGHPWQRQVPRAETSSTQGNLCVALGGDEDHARVRETISNEVRNHIQPLLNSAPNMVLNQSAVPRGLRQNSTQASLSSNRTKDGRRRDGCYTCKDRKKRCDCEYRLDETSGTQKCETCLRVGIPCDMIEPIGARDPVQREIRKRERRRLMKLKKRSREESESLSISSRDRSATMAPADTSRQPSGEDLRMWDADLLSSRT